MSERSDQRPTPSEGDLDAAAKTLLTHECYGDPAQIDAATALLRAHAPIRRVEHPDYSPISVLSNYADIREVELNSKVWGQGGHPFLRSREEIRRIRDGEVPHVRMLIDYDSDEHRAYRGVLKTWFTPRSLTRLSDRIDELAVRAVDRLAAADGTCDFAKDVAAQFPLETILSMLGLPESDYDFMLGLSDKLLNSGPDSDSASRPASEMRDLIESYDAYFHELVEDRRANPTEDLSTVIATALIDGNPMPRPDTVGYFIILSVAGHETTAATMSAGIHALATHPEQFAELRANVEDDAFVTNAAEEILRWSTSVKHFCRTAYEPTSVSGVDFAKGSRVFMSYASANRDEAVFDEPHVFDLRRTNARDHLAFGFGPHHCLGHHLARLQVRALLSEIGRRVVSLELVGEPTFAREIATSGPTSLPVTAEVS